jgi:hypothetical protein
MSIHLPQSAALSRCSRAKSSSGNLPESDSRGTTPRYFNIRRYLPRLRFGPYCAPCRAAGIGHFRIKFSAQFLLEKPAQRTRARIIAQVTYPLSRSALDTPITVRKQFSSSCISLLLKIIIIFLE